MMMICVLVRHSCSRAVRNSQVFPGIGLFSAHILKLNRAQTSLRRISCRREPGRVFVELRQSAEMVCPSRCHLGSSGGAGPAGPIGPL